MTHLEQRGEDALATIGQPGWDFVRAALDEPVQPLCVVVVKRQKAAHEGVEQNAQAPHVRLVVGVGCSGE